MVVGDDDSTIPNFFPKKNIYDVLIDKNNDSMILALVAWAEDSDSNSWGSHLENNLDNSDMPYRDIVRSYDCKSDNGSANVDKTNNVEPKVVEYTMSNVVWMAREEPKRLIFERDNDKELYAVASLDHYSEAYCLGNQELRARFHTIKNDKWSNNYKFAFIWKVKNDLEYNLSGQNSINDVDVDAKLTTRLMECKIEDYDNASWLIVKKKSLNLALRQGLIIKST